jgi:hypothetical protein
MGYPRYLLQHEGRVLFIGASRTGVPRGIDTGLLAEGVDLEAGVVGKDDAGNME